MVIILNLDIIIFKLDSNLKINNQLLNGDYKNVRGLMYGNVYGTATSRD